MKKILKHWINILLLLSFIALASAFIAEYFFNLLPCKMCFNQRYSYYAIIIFISIFYLFKKKFKIIILLFNQLAIIYGLFYALWHTGIERQIFSGPASCSGTFLKTNSIDNLKEQINNQAIVNCSDIAWSVMGFSAATINSMLLLFILFFNSICILHIIYEQKKTKQKK